MGRQPQERMGSVSFTMHAILYQLTDDTVMPREAKSLRGCELNVKVFGRSGEPKQASKQPGRRLGMGKGAAGG